MGRGKDGHEQRTSGTTTTTVTSANPGHGDFILVTAASDNNWTNFAGEDNLWQGESGINNPCPSGYRLPTIAELETERLSWSSNNAAGAFASNLKLPLAGYRYYGGSGILDNVGSNGYLRSSTINGTSADYLLYTSSNAFANSTNRSYGFSVRCIKD